MKRILIVSGSSHVQILFGGFLKAHGYEIEIAENQVSGSKLLKNLYINLVINDLGIQNDQKSQELIDQWNAKSLPQSPPTIFLAENVPTSTQDFVRQSRNCWILLKPCDEIDLIDLVAQIIGS